MAILKSSGREPWIFRVDKPDDLVGSHCELMASSLQPDEPILHLIYSPAWEGTRAPFDIRGVSASRAIALTPTRWVISEDLHRPVFPPRVTSIPFDRILVVEKGSALLLAWLVVRFREGEALRTLAVLHKAIGSHHFDDAVRTYRRLVAEALPDIPVSGDPDEWQHIPRYLAQELMPILNDGEEILASTRTEEQWHQVRRRFRRIEHCAMPASALLITEHDVLYCESETPQQPGLVTFGVNVRCVPAGAIRMTELHQKRNDHCALPVLRLTLTRGPVRHDFDAAIPHE